MGVDIIGVQGVDIIGKPVCSLMAGALGVERWFKSAATAGIFSNSKLVVTHSIVAESGPVFRQKGCAGGVRAVLLLFCGGATLAPARQTLRPECHR